MKKCENCGEEAEEIFESCWNCGAAYDDLSSDSESDENQNLPPAKKKEYLDANGIYSNSQGSGILYTLSSGILYIGQGFVVLSLIYQISIFKFNPST